jgi:hypothetical protein
VGAVLHGCLSLERGRSFPRETVRDLLGITRALYRAEMALDMPLVETRCAQLEEIGKQYRLALKLAASGPGTMGHRAAWVWAEKATAALGQFVAGSSDLALMVSSSAERLSR